MVDLLSFEIFFLLVFVLFRPDFDLLNDGFFICLKGIVVIRIYDLFSWVFFLFVWRFVLVILETIGQKGRPDHLSIFFFFGGFQGPICKFFGWREAKNINQGWNIQTLCTYIYKIKFLKKLGGQPQHGSVPACVCSLGFWTFVVQW